MRIDIPTGRGKGRSVPLTAERLVNMYAEEAPKKSKAPVVLHGTPGFKLFQEVGTRKLIRGLYRTIDDGVLYAVVGNTLYSLASDGTATSLGTIAGSGRVGIADNGTQLCIVSGSKGYIYDTTSGLVEIADTDFPGANTVTFIDGFFVFNNSNAAQKSQFFISSLLDGKTYDALDFATAERYPDSLLRVFADHSELILFGETSIEIWFNAGNADFPFARAQGSVIEQGLGARWTVEKVDESVIWLDNEGMVRRLSGINPQRISTHAIENAIAKGDWQNASSWSYVEEGHQFYVLNVPKAQIGQTAGTYVWDAATGLWHERQSYEIDNCRLGFYAYAYNKHIVGDLFNGKIYEMSLDTYDEDGAPLIAELQFPQVQNDGDRFMVDKLQLDMEVGNLGPFDQAGTPAVPGAQQGIYVIDEVGVAGAHQLFKSTDIGDNWTAVGTPVTLSNVTNKMAGIAAIGPLVLVASGDLTSTYCDWQYTTDDGTTWTKVAGDGVTAPQAHSSATKNILYTMAQPSVVNGFFYVLDHDRFVWKTEDCVTWTKLGQLPGSGYASISENQTSRIFQFGEGDLYAIGTEAQTAQANTDGVRAVYKSTDGGVTWSGHFTDYPQEYFSGQSSIATTATHVLSTHASSFTVALGYLRRSTDLSAWSDATPTIGGDSFSAGSNSELATTGRYKYIASSGSLIGLLDVNGDLDPSGDGEPAIIYSTDNGATWTRGPSYWINQDGNGLLSINWIGTKWLISYEEPQAYLSTSSALTGFVPSTSSPFPTDYWRLAEGEYTAENVSGNSPGTPAVPGKTFGEPKVMLDVSGNTRTFDMTQQWRSMGKTGQYDQRVIWRRLGQHRSFTPRFRISSPVKRAVFTAYAQIRPAR